MVAPLAVRAARKVTPKQQIDGIVSFGKNTKDSVRSSSRRLDIGRHAVVGSIT